MNRAERRRLERESNHNPTYNLKLNDIQKVKQDSTNEAADRIFLLMLGLPVLTLKDKWGFGKVRLERFVDQVLDLYDSFEKGYLTFEDIKKCLEDEAGIEIQKK